MSISNKEESLGMITAKQVLQPLLQSHARRTSSPNDSMRSMTAQQQASRAQLQDLPSGLRVGAPETEQLMRAINDAYPDLRQPLAITDVPEGADILQEAVEAELAKIKQQQQQQPGPTTSKKTAAEGPSSSAATSGPSSSSSLRDPAIMKSLVKMQGRLLASAPAFRVHLFDVLQRRLASAMPASTTMNSESKLNASVQQLKSRLAISKGRHDVRYIGYSAALDLLR